MLHTYSSMLFGVWLMSRGLPKAFACDTCVIHLNDCVHVPASPQLSQRDNCACAGDGVSGQQQVIL